MKNVSKLRLMGALAASIFTMGTLAACGGEAASMSNGDLLKAAINNHKAMKSYHMEVDSGQGEGNVKVSADVDAANKSFKSVMQFPTYKSTTIKVGAEYYNSMRDAEYEKSSGSFAELFLMLWDKVTPENIDKVGSSIKDGSPATETMDGAETRHLILDVKDFASLGSPSGSDLSEGTVHLWISTGARPLLFKMQVLGKREGKETSTTFTWSKHDAPVTIDTSAIPTPNPAADANAELLKAAVENMDIRVDSYYLIATLTSAGKTIAVEGEYDKRSISSMFKGSVTAGGQQTQVIRDKFSQYRSTDGGRTYIEVSSNDVQVLDDTIQQLDGMWPIPFLIDNNKKKLTNSEPATESIEGVDSKHLVMPISAISTLSEGLGASEETTGELHVWINTEGTPYVRQIKLDGKNGNQEVQALVKWSRFGEEFKIEAPANITPVP